MLIANQIESTERKELAMTDSASCISFADNAERGPEFHRRLKLAEAIEVRARRGIVARGRRAKRKLLR
jgi:hypothetical protein